MPTSILSKLTSKLTIKIITVMSLSSFKFGHPYYVSDLKNLLMIGRKKVVTSVSAIGVFTRALVMYDCEKY